MIFMLQTDLRELLDKGSKDSPVRAMLYPDLNSALSAPNLFSLRS